MRRMVDRRTLLLVAVCSVAACGSNPDRATAPRMIDLGHALAADDPSWEGPPAFERRVAASFEQQGYAAGRIAVDEHFGTHLDAPAHFSAGGWTVDTIPVDRLFRPAVIVDVTAKALSNPDYQVTAEDIRAFEAAHGEIPEGAVALVATGWDRFWPERSKYMGEIGGVKHFPGLSVEAVTLLAKERRVAGIGIDTASIDYGRSAAFEAHKVSMALNVYHIENAAGLTALPPTGFRVLVAPIKIAGGSGGPTRVFALVP
jgi:kynurenine formamidase